MPVAYSSDRGNELQYKGSWIQDVLLSRIPRQYLVPWNSPTPSSVLSQDEEIVLWLSSSVGEY